MSIGCELLNHNHLGLPEKHASTPTNSVGFGFISSHSEAAFLQQLRWWPRPHIRMIKAQTNQTTPTPCVSPCNACDHSKNAQSVKLHHANSLAAEWLPCQLETYTALKFGYVWVMCPGCTHWPCRLATYTFLKLASCALVAPTGRVGWQPTLSWSLCHVPLLHRCPCRLQPTLSWSLHHVHLRALSLHQ